MLKSLTILTALAAISLASAAHAEVVPIFNTGVDGSGNVLSNGTTPDLHYTLVQAPTGAATTLGVLTSVSGFPIPPWLADDSLSTWIGPTTPEATGPAGSYDFQTTFSLTDLDAASAVITGQWSSDNAGYDILVNGVSTGNSFGVGAGTPGDPYSFTQWHSFTISSGFVSGTNTLDFIINNLDNGGIDPNPTGLRVEVTGTAPALGNNTVGDAPEPGTFGMFGIGSAIVFAILKLRRKYAEQ